MRHSRYRGYMRGGRLLSIGIIIFFWILLIPTFQKINSHEEDLYRILLNGVSVGTASDQETAQACLRQARRELAAQYMASSNEDESTDSSDAMFLADAELTVTGEEVIWEEVSSRESIVQQMKTVLLKNAHDTLKHSYTVKINDYSVNLASKAEVEELLRASIEKYDTENEYQVNLILDPDREVNVLTAEVVSKEEAHRSEKSNTQKVEAGIESVITKVMEEVEPFTTEKSFEDYELGLQSLSFGDKVEITESYLPQEELTALSDAIDEVTKDKETNQIYEVRSGDTLSTIAEEFGLSLDDLIARNASLEDENSIIRVGDELTVVVPEPELTVLHTTQEYYEEDYEAEVQYVPNDDWYTTKQVTLQEPSAGHRKVVALVSYENGTVASTDIQKEEITYQAVPKIVERGTKIPPTYIKPISGGRLSSGFGRRTAPTRGASTYHKGVDWATPVGTAVMASSAGTVTRAGWGSGYGYCVYISHADGKVTRYGHLSKILVKVGQSVSQGEKIALSGNTGVSTGAHLHFEILVNGTQVNPLNYLN